MSIIPPHATDAPSILDVFMYVVLIGIPRSDEITVLTRDAVSDAAAVVPLNPPVRATPVLFIIFLPPERQPIPIISEHTKYAEVGRDANPLSEHSKKMNFCPSCAPCQKDDAEQKNAEIVLPRLPL